LRDMSGVGGSGSYGSSAGFPGGDGDDDIPSGDNLMCVWDGLSEEPIVPSVVGVRPLLPFCLSASVVRPDFRLPSAARPPDRPTPDSRRRPPSAICHLPSHPRMTGAIGPSHTRPGRPPLRSSGPGKTSTDVFWAETSSARQRPQRPRWVVHGRGDLRVVLGALCHLPSATNRSFIYLATICVFEG